MLKVGTDIVEVSRFLDKEDSFLVSIFTSNEILEGNKRQNKAEYYASRFAAKEAFAKTQEKAFSTIKARDIEIKNDSNGMPYISLSEEHSHLLANKNVTLSISHEKTFAIAVVVVYA